MADLLTHVLVAYALATALALRYEWLAPQYATMAMFGAVVPDLNRVELFIPADAVEAATGLPFSWGAFHTLGGAAVAVAVGALLVPARIRSRVLALLALGALSHLTLDFLLLTPSGYAYPVAWPLTGYQPPAPNLYLSSDRWSAAVAGALAAATWYAVRLRDDRDAADPDA